LVAIEELLRGVTIVAWLGQGLLRIWLPELSFWRYLATAVKAVADMRRKPPFDLVRLEMSEVKVRVGFW
jgi:hypothetical protein